MIDIKLGTILWDESASLEKQQRMEQAARNTTSLETGIRLTGFQVPVTLYALRFSANQVN